MITRERDIMIRFATGVTMTNAMTDLIVGLVLIPLTIAIKRIDAKDEYEKKLWVKFMSVLIAVCLTGFIAHGFIWNETAYGFLWVGLYAIMFVAVRNFFFVAAHKHTNGEGIGRIWSIVIDAVSLALYILLSVLSLKHINPIRIFVVYGIFIIVPAFVLFGILVHRREDKASKLVLTAFLPQVVGGVYMLCRVPEFKFIVPMDHNCIYHMCLLVSVIIFYYAAKRSLLQENADEKEKEESFV